MSKYQPNKLDLLICRSKFFVLHWSGFKLILLKLHCTMPDALDLSKETLDHSPKFYNFFIKVKFKVIFSLK